MQHAPSLFDDTQKNENPADAWDRDSDKRVLDELFLHVADYRTTKRFNELLQFVSRFHFYAPFNAMLVHVQKPGTKFVAPAHKWRLAYGRTIRPGAQPLVILQPMGPVMFVFDVSDTEGRPLPPEIENPFAVRAGKIGSQLSKSIENAKRDGIRITEARQGSQLAGCIGPTRTANATLEIDKETTVPLRYELILNANHDESSRYATLVHELAHLYCGHLGTPNDRWWPNRRGLPHEIEEFEAESVAYLVCHRAGILPKSDQYLSGYLKRDGEIPNISLDCVLTSAGLIERMGRETLKLRK